MAKGCPVILAGLDIGTSKTAVIIAEAASGHPKLLGCAETKSIGVAKGCIESPASTAKAILQALEQAQRSAGVKPAAVYVSFNGDTIAVKDCLVNLNPQKNSACRSKHRGFAAVPAGLSEGDHALYLIPSKDIPGRSVFDAQAGARAIIAPSHNIKDISKAAHLAGLKVLDVVFGPVAAAEALLTQAEREFGTIVIDIGAGSTSVSIFDRGELRETAVISIGGEHLVSDLAIGLHTSLNQAVEILTGCNLSGGGEDGVGAEDISGSLANSIIEARLCEILYLVNGVIQNLQYPGLLPGGAVFCGGVTLLGGFVPFAEKILQLPVRVGSIQADGYPLHLTFANAWGMVKRGTQHMPNPELRVAAHCEPGVLMAKLIKWLQGRLKNQSRL